MEGKRGRKRRQPTTQACALAGNQTSNLFLRRMEPDQLSDTGQAGAPSSQVPRFESPVPEFTLPYTSPPYPASCPA